MAHSIRESPENLNTTCKLILDQFYADRKSEMNATVMIGDLLLMIGFRGRYERW